MKKLLSLSHLLSPFLLVFLTLLAPAFLPAQISLPCELPGGLSLCKQFGAEPVQINITSATSTSTLATTSWVSTVVLINATLTVNSSFTIDNSLIRFGDNGRITVVAGGDFNSLDSRYFSCSSILWDGIRAEGGNTFFTSNQIEDAQNAITIASNSANLVITRNTFNRNRVDILVPTNIAANAVIAGNLFDFTSPNAFGAFSEAGISAKQASFVTVGLPFTTDIKDLNTIRNHLRGADGDGATMNFRYSKFECNSTGILSVRGRVDVRGSGGFRNLFTNEQMDIRFPQSSMYVYNTDFNHCMTDNMNSNSNMMGEIVEVMGQNLFEIDNNSGVPDLKRGIYMERSSGGTGLIARNRIEGNSFVIHQFVPQSSRSAIAVTATPGIADIMRIWSNVVLVEPGGSSEPAPVPSPLFDIIINSAPNFNIRFNNIHTSNTDLANHRNRWGFYLHAWMSPSSGNWFSDNHVFGNAANYDHGMCAFHFVESGPWNICDNSADYTLRGFHITANCATSVFGGNVFGHHARSAVPSMTPETGALQMEPGSNLGLQNECRHNIWQLADYSPDRGAWHKGANFAQSRFDYNPTILGENPTPTFPASNWFFATCTTEPLPNEHCGSEVPFTTTLDELESKLVADNQSYTQPSTVLNWEEQRNLIVKLLRYPDLKTAYPLANSFYNTHINTSVGKFAQFDEMLHNAMLVQPNQMLSLDNLRAQITGLIGRVDSLDGTLPNSLAAENVGAQFFSYRSLLLASMQQLLVQEASLKAQITATRIDSLAVCAQYLTTLPQNTTFEWNQAFLNGLAIKKGQLITFSENDLSILRSIATQCPEIAGRTRDIAMNLLPLGDPAIFRPDVPNIPGCQGLYGEGEDRHIASFQHSVGIQLSPNPVSDNLSIKFTKPFSGNIEIFDLTGKNLGIFRNIKLLYEHDVPTSQLSPGVYLLSVTSETGERTVMKFIVSR